MNTDKLLKTFKWGEYMTDGFDPFLKITIMKLLPPLNFSDESTVFECHRHCWQNIGIPCYSESEQPFKWWIHASSKRHKLISIILDKRLVGPRPAIREGLCYLITFHVTLWKSCILVWDLEGAATPSWIEAGYVIKLWTKTFFSYKSAKRLCKYNLLKRNYELNALLWWNSAVVNWECCVIRKIINYFSVLLQTRIKKCY